MRHSTVLTATALGAVLAVAGLGGCSSGGDGGSDSAAPAASTPAASGAAATAPGGADSGPGGSAKPAKPPRPVDGHVDFTGDATGSADFTGGVACEIKGGKLVGVTTPDVLAKKQIFPSLIATTADSPAQVALFNTPDGASYSGHVAQDAHVTARKSGASWTVVIDGLRIAKDYSGSGGVVTLKGSLTCTHLT